jgi:NHL repeat
MFVLLGYTLRWNPIGITVAGNGSVGSSLNQLNSPSGVFVDTNDVLYVADTNNHRILKISSSTNGTNSGTVVAGIAGVSTVRSDTLNSLRAVYVDSQQNLYIAD